MNLICEFKNCKQEAIDNGDHPYFCRNHMKTQPKNISQEWTKEFDDRFVEKKVRQVDASNSITIYPWKNPHAHQSQEVKAYIKDLLRTKQVEMLERILSRIETNPDFNPLQIIRFKLDELKKDL